MNQANVKVSFYLKEIARICNINRPLVFHVARHTYATEITLSHGVPVSYTHLLQLELFK